MGMRHTLAARNLPDKISNAKKMPHKGAEHISRVLPVALEKLLANRPSETTEGQLLHLPDLQQASAEAAVGTDQRQDGLRGELRETPLIERGHPLLTGYPFPIRRLTSLGHLNSCPVKRVLAGLDFPLTTIGLGELSSCLTENAPKPVEAPAMPITAKPLLMLPAPKIAGLLPEGQKVVEREPEKWLAVVVKTEKPLVIEDIDVMPGLMPAPIYAKSDIELAYERRVQVVRTLDKLIKVA